MANGNNKFGFDELFPAGLPETQTGGFRPLFEPAQKAEQVAVATEAKKQSLIEKMGYDADDTIGQLGNLGASLVSGASRLAGNLVTLPIDAVSAMAQASVPDAHIDAYSRVQSGKALPGDEILLAQTAPGDDGVPQTYMERMQGLDGLRQVSKAVADTFDLSSIVDQSRRETLGSDIKEATADGVDRLRDAGIAIEAGRYGDAALDGLIGAGQTIGTALGAGLSNPAAATEYVVENLPNLAATILNPALGLAGNVGYGANEYREGITDFQAENQGALPSAEDRTKMALWATAAVAAEQVADVGLAKGVTKAAKGSVRNAATATAGAAAREGATEGFQTVAENQAHLKDTSLEDIVESATIGALVGGNMRGAAAFGQVGQTAKEKAAVKADVQQAFNDAVQSGDVSALADPALPTYAPVRAIDALNQLSQGATAEQVTANLAQADSIQEVIANRAAEVQARLDTDYDAQLADLNDMREQMVEQGAPAQDLEFVDSEIAAARAYTPEVRAQDEAVLARLNTELESVHQATERMRVDTSPEQAEVADIVSNAQTGEAQAVDRLLTLTMTNPEIVDTQVAADLAQNPALNDAQRTALQRFSEAQVAANALKGRSGVRSDIAAGGDGFKGVSQYRNAVRMALANGNVEAARSQVDGIASFAASRVSKLNAITAAYEQVKGTDAKINIVRNEQGEWNPTELKGKALKEAGGLVISRTSHRLRDDVGLEAEVLGKTAAALGALVEAAPTPVAAPAVSPAAAEQGEVATPATETVAEAPANAEPAVAADAEANVVSDQAPVEAAVEQAPENVASPTEPTVSDTAGVLSVIANRTGAPVTAENYTAVNLVGELFTQSAKSESDASVRPLVAQKDLMSAVRSGEVSLSDFLAQEGPVTGPQQAALNSFTTFAQTSEQAIRNAFRVTETRAKRPDFFFRDMAQFLQNADGQIDENVATAVSLGLFSWINENATQLRNSDEAINAILLRDLDADITSAEYAALSRIGTRQSVVAAQLGGRIVQALGLQLSKDGTQAELGKLEASIGARAIAAAANLGLLERVQFSDVTLQALMKSGVPGNPKQSHTFVRIKANDVDGKVVADDQIAAIRAANTGSQSVLSKVFSVEAAGVEPSYTPVKFDQQFAKRTKQDVPKVLAETLEKEGAKAHRVRQNMWHVWGRLSNDALATIGGAVDTTEAATHVENIASRNAKSDGIRQQVENFDSFVKTMMADQSTEGLEQDLFFGRSVWKPQRVGLTANVINPQTSKVHRHMMAMEGWNATVEFNNPAMVNNFKLRVLEAFGVKTEADITANVLAGYDSKVNDPAIQAGVDALVDILRDNSVPTNEDAILAAVAAGGENFHSFDALVALAEEKIARQDGKASFDTQMMGEVDGLTNGPMLSIAMLGAKGFETLNQGGFYELDSPYQQFNEFKANGGLDLYESNIAGAVQRLQGRDLQKLNALQVITGQLATDQGKVTKKGRNAIKKPLTALMFGSNPTNAVEGMADGFIDSIYTKMEGAAQNRSQAEMTEIVNAVNELIPSRKDKLDATLGWDVVLNTRLTDKQKEAIKKTFYELLGKPTEDALADNYATFIARRNVINQTAQVAFHVYNAVRDGVTAHVIENSAAVPRNQAGEALRVLTKAQQEQVNQYLGDMAPILQTAMSQASEQHDAGMYMAKSERTLDSSKPFESEVAFGELAQTIAPDGKLMGVGSAKVSAMTRNDIDPGVMPFITSIHSMDSSIASTVYGQMTALNVHDALGVDLNNMELVGQNLNKATFDNLVNYSAPSAMAVMLDQVLAGAARVLQDPAIAARVQPLLAQVGKDMAQKAATAAKQGNIIASTVEGQVAAIRNVAKQADTDKLSMLANMQAVGQYATEGGSYVVTDADRKAASDKLASFGSDFSSASTSIAQQLDVLGKIDTVAQSFGAEVALSAQSLRTLAPATSLNSLDAVMRNAEGQLREDVQQTIVDMQANNIPLANALNVLPEERAADVVAAVAAVAGPKLSVWGQLGKPVVESNVDMVQLLETTEMTAPQLAEALIAYVQDPFQKTVLQMARRSLPANLAVRYVTSETGVDGAFGEGVDKSRGWYAQSGNREAIFVKSPEFVESGVTPEMLSHELVHASLASLVDQHAGKQSAVGRAVAGLEEIRGQVANFIQMNGALSAKYRNATSNVHELLAWGLTNQDFQKEVLAQVTVREQTTSLLSGLQAFIKRITAMLFNGSVKESSAMAALVAQSAGLFREAAAVRESRNASTLKYEDAVDEVQKLTATQVFDSLSTLPGNKVDAAHNVYLRDLLESTVQPIYGPYDINKDPRKQALTSLDVMLKAVQTGTAPFSTDATTKTFITTAEEAFVLESVQASVAHAMNNPSTLFVRGALSDLFQKARASLNERNFHPGDWATASVNEKAIAKAKFDFLFNPTQGVGAKNDYLSRFAALGLASKEVRNVLSFSTANAEAPLKSLPWAARLTELFRRLMTRLGQIHTKVNGDMAARDNLTGLVERLVDIEAKRKNELLSRKLGYLDQVEAFLGGQAGEARVKAAAALTALSKKNIPIVRGVAAVAAQITNDNLDAYLDGITTIRDANQKSRHGVTMGLLTEWRGVYDSRQLASELFKAAKGIEKDRKDMIENTVSSVNSAFANAGADLSQEQRDGLTKFFLRTNAQAIEAAVGMDRLKELLNDPAEMAKYRADLELRVKQASPDFLYMISQTKDLAHHRVVGGSTSANLMQSTANISAMFGTKKAGAVQPALVPLLDQLMSVYAMEYSDDLPKRHAMQVFRTETARTEPNGIEFMLKLHRGLQEKATTALFNGTEALQMTGYNPEIHDNKIEVLLIAPKDVNQYLRAGWQVGSTTQQDPNYKLGEQRLLVTRRGAGQTALLTGAVSYTGMSARGTSPVTEAKNMMQGTQTTSAKVRQDIAKAKDAAIAGLFSRGMSYDPRKAKAGHMAPTLAPDGQIADYRHLMTEHNRDVLLDRDSSMDQVLGVFAGQIVDKVSSADQNADVVRAMHDQYRADYNNRPSSYLAVGPDVADKSLAEAYRLLPHSTKEEIKKVWKSDTMYVPADQIDMIFGYRKFSLTNAFQALPTERNVFEKTLVAVAGGLFGEKAELRIGQAEDIAQALVKEAKDILVVKNIFTLAGNIMSNMTLLAWEGVPIKSAMESHAVAIKGALDYRKDSKRLMQLQQMVEIGYTAQTADVDAEIVALRDRLARNPIKPLVDAGLMPTIVEDVEVDDDRYTYKSVLGRKVEKFTSKVPALLREAGKQVYMTHDTAQYKFLSQATQLSDLVARFSMYQHLTNRAKDPMSSADALRLAEESFVNYDIPSHRTIQYLNDMGILMFTKYYLRIQKVIMRLVRERPARGLMLAATEHFISGVQSVMDSSWLNKIGNNPLTTGPFGFLGALDELPAIKLMD